MIDEISKNKAITVSAIMNNKKLSKAVADALNSPIGSSKREKAAAILSVFNKGKTTTSQVLDGKGGMPEKPYDATLYGPQGAKEGVHIGSQGASDLQSQGWGLTEGSYTAPSTSEIVPQKTKVVFPSVSELKPFDSKIGTFDVDPSYVPSLDISPGFDTTFTSTPLSYQAKIDDSYNKLIEEGYTKEKALRDTMESFNAIPTVQQNKINRESEELVKKEYDPLLLLESYNLILEKYGMPPTTAKYKATIKYNELIASEYTPEAANRKVKEEFGQDVFERKIYSLTDEVPIIAEEEPPLDGSQKDPKDPKDSKAPATYPGYEYYDSLSEKDKEMHKELIERDISGFGPQTAAWSLMDDMEAMKKLGVPDWLLPTHGASLTGQVSALADTLREETGLTRTENNLRNLQERGMTITEDLSAYIKGKDKYIKNINDMMKKSKEHEKTIDMSLPENQRSMKNYNNYLSILKGRQQNRYIDFLNTGITYHNAELTRATNSYNTAYQNFNRELATQTSITKENYERLNNILMDMYSNVTDREKIAAEKVIMKSQVAQAQFTTAKVEVELINLALGIEDSGWSKLTENSQSQAEANYIKSSDQTADQAEIDFSYLSEAEKLKWTGSTTTDSAENVQFYVDEILRAEVGGIDSTYYDAETGEIKWTSVPKDIRAQVRNRRTEMVAEDQRARAAAAGDKDAESMGAIQWLKHHLNPFNWGD